jgi:hypothetical protein
MMLWVLIVLGAAPLVMAAIMVVILRSGALQRLHERQRERETGED